MVPDLKSRRDLASAFRHFATGRITNRDFELRVDLISREDPAVDAILDEVWYWYDDLREHPLELSPIGRTVAARCYLFLKSDLPFEYSVPSRLVRFGMLLLDLPTFGLVSGLFRRKLGLLACAPDLWPFRRQDDLDSAALAFASPA